ncbi:MAG: sigma 54-interacting transcriptional regulator [Betaproteobacteria bacterium]|nr:sigma 54-interacting transcriptional regulator [Betaproteobacteria bacterium]
MTAPSPHTGNLVLVDDDPDLLKLLSIRLKSAGHRVNTATSAQQALSMLSAERPDLVVTDLKMAGLDGMDLFHEIERKHTGLPVIILTAHGSIPDAVAATREGVFGYLTKPYDPAELIAQIERALALHGSASQRTDQSWRAEIITKSPLMEDLLKRAERVALAEASILIQGESGTGKELLARAIHRASPRRDKPFVGLNCGAIPEALLESELFGHRKGAFTGATADHKGLFLEADTGTMLLDEIGDMPLALQVKLLRALENREIRPVGATKVIPIDVRIISASHRDLVKARAEGTFREDLYYRLNVVTLKLPPLRERREDIPLLIAHFLKSLSESYGKDVNALSPDAMDMLVAHPWPGNIRQLSNTLEQAVALSGGEIVSTRIVERAMQRELPVMESFEEARRRFEHDYLTRLLKLTNGNAAQAARIAKRNRTEFYRLLQRHGIEAGHFKEDMGEGH